MATKPSWYPVGRGNSKLDYGGQWADPSGEGASYLPFALIEHEGGIWVCLGESSTKPTIGDPNWELLGSLLDVYYLAAPILNITAPTQVPLTRHPTNHPTSPGFTIVAGDLRADVPLLVSLQTTLRWTPNIGSNNGDAGIVLYAELTGTGTIAFDLPFGDYFTSPRPTAEIISGEQNLGLVAMDVGDVLRINVDDYPGQSQETDLNALGLFAEVSQRIS